MTEDDEGYASSDSETDFVDAVTDDVSKIDLKRGNISESREEIEDEIPQIVIEKDITKALHSKAKGNELFRTKRYDESIQEYSQAIIFCPLDETNQENLATFYGNRAAAYFTIEEYAQAVDDCTESIKLKPDYVKVLMRRCQAHEKLERYDEALNDAKEINVLDPTYPKINDIIKRLDKLNEEKMTKMKDEALGKLKELGNSILGNFGMSLDNFKMNQDPATGGWNISMQK